MSNYTDQELENHKKLEDLNRSVRKQDTINKFSKILEILDWIGSRNCEQHAEGSSNEIPCYKTMTYYTEWCFPCVAKHALETYAELSVYDHYTNCPRCFGRGKLLPEESVSAQLSPETADRAFFNPVPGDRWTDENHTTWYHIEGRKKDRILLRIYTSVDKMPSSAAKATLVFSLEEFQQYLLDKQARYDQNRMWIREGLNRGIWPEEA